MSLVPRIGWRLTPAVRLNALEFSPSKHQRKLLRRWNNFVRHGDSDAKPGKGKAAANNDFLSSVHACEHSASHSGTTRHRFTVTLEASSFTQEKYDLFQRYQNDIHNDPATRAGFKRFLVETPIKNEPINYNTTNLGSLPKSYGSYHQMYRVDGQLIAFGVLDILPGCVSSVYFIYDKRWERFSLGKLSALREAALAREMFEAGAEKAHWLYMGFYIYSCQKMQYKGDYAPSQLLDPDTFEWYLLDTCKPLLERYRYAVFSSPDRSKVEREAREPEWPGDELARLRIIEDIDSKNVMMVAYAEDSKYWQDEDDRERITEVAAALGGRLCEQVLLLCN